jgi:hypothetical protein
LLEEHGIECNFERSGRLTGALSEAQLQGIARESKTLRQVTGVEHQILSRADLRNEIAKRA